MLATTPGCSARTLLIRSTGSLSANSPSIRCLVVTSSRGTSAFCAAVTVISLMSTAGLLEREVLRDRLAGETLRPVTRTGL